jgi:hypothetical protein
LFGIENKKTVSERALFLNGIVRSLLEPDKGIAFGRSILLQWAFGGWAAIEEKGKWATVFGVSQKMPTRKTDRLLLTNADLRQHHRKICVDYLEEHPGCSRLGFTRAEYRTFRWLLYNDRTWLDRRLPIPLKGMRQLRLFD